MADSVFLRKVAIAAAFVVQSFGATAANVAYVGAGSSGDYLNFYGHTVTQITNPTTAGFLAGFDAVVVSSNSTFSDVTLVGDEVKSFADAGGGVVLGQFVFQGQWAISGGINSPGYNPFVNDASSSSYNIGSSLGTIYDAASPLFNGLTVANISTQYQANVGLDAGATLVADWTSDRKAIAFNQLSHSKVVGLNLFPSDGELNADTQQLVSNAIDFSMTAAVPEPQVYVLMLLGLSLVGAAARRRRG